MNSFSSDLLSKLLGDFGLTVARHEVSLSDEIQEIQTALNTAVHYGDIADDLYQCYNKK